jgi:hypothetical protein
VFIDGEILNTEALFLIYSTLGTVDQPGWWPPEYIIGFKIILMAVIILIGWKSLTWIIQPGR